MLVIALINALFVNILIKYMQLQKNIWAPFSFDGISFFNPKLRNLQPTKTLKCEVVQKISQISATAVPVEICWLFPFPREREKSEKCTVVWIEAWIFKDFPLLELHSRIVLISVPTESSLVNSEWIADALNPVNNEGG